MSAKYNRSTRLFARKNNSLGRFSGFTLVEVMIVVIIQLLLIKVLLDVFLGSFSILRSIKAMMKMQTQMTSITEMLTADIKLSHYQGCMKAKPTITGTSTQITIKHMAYPSQKLAKGMQELNRIVVEKSFIPRPGELLMIADCQRSELLGVKQVYKKKTGNIVVTQSLLHNLYGANADISRYETYQYFINQSQSKLYLQVNSNIKETLADNVKRIIFHFYVVEQGQVREVLSDNVNGTSMLAGIGIDLLLGNENLQQQWHAYVAN